MGVLNVTPDSFSGDGLMAGDAFLQRSLHQAETFLAAGADILDVGGESTRPGSEPVPPEEEAGRVVPVIEAIVGTFPDAVVSIDTSKAAVAAAALDAGARIVNDVWALTADAAMAGLVAERGAPVVLMHNRSRAKAVDRDARIGGRYEAAAYGHLMDDIAADLKSFADAATAQGIDRGQIVLDPGIGFGKTVTQNLALINHVDRVKALGLPVLIGASRKSFIGQILDAPIGERDDGTAATVAIGIARGADIVRVHDVGTMVRIARMTDAILRAPADGGSEAEKGAA